MIYWDEIREVEESDDCVYPPGVCEDCPLRRKCRLKKLEETLRIEEVDSDENISNS